MPFRSSKIKEAFYSISFTDILNIVKEKSKVTDDPVEILSWVVNSYAEDEQGLVAGYYLGMIIGNLYSMQAEGVSHGRGEDDEGAIEEITEQNKEPSGEGTGKRGRKKRKGDEG